MLLGSHVEVALQEKVKRGEYVDLAKLLPRERNLHSEDQRMELVNRGGQSFFIPVSDRDSGGGITSFNKWEQAFRVFMNIYLQTHPNRSGELLQYAHIIFTASSSYIWDNVYTYDKEFRVHMDRFLNHNWCIILQQAWTMYLKDRLKFSDSHFKSSNRNGKKKPAKDSIKDYAQQASVVNLITNVLNAEIWSFRHGAHICRKKLNKGGQGSSSSQATVTNSGQNSVNTAVTTK